MQSQKTIQSKVDIPYSKSEILNMVPKGYDILEEDFPHLAYKPNSIKKSIFSHSINITWDFLDI